jgi:hypothetical protein
MMNAFHSSPYKVQTNEFQARPGRTEASIYEGNRIHGSDAEAERNRLAGGCCVVLHSMEIFAGENISVGISATDRREKTVARLGISPKW